MKEARYYLQTPCTLSDNTVNLVADITERITRISLSETDGIHPELRRNNRIKTIQASLALENNSLSLDQVSAIIQGQRVLGPSRDILEVKNACITYDKLLEYDPYSIDALLAAHGMLMRNLTEDAGRFRKGGAGIFNGSQLIHMAPPAQLVEQQMAQLMEWVENTQSHPLIKSCIFQYQFEFIHPFSDGNGRMGRMWQTLLLYGWNPLLG